MQNLVSLFPTDDALGLITDFYELTMAAGYWTKRHNPKATFEASVRSLPVNRSYLLTAGLEQVVHYLLNLRFTNEQVDWLAGNEVFKHVDAGFWDYLRNFRFTGDLWASPEGTVMFANEPFLRVSGNLIECQLLETYILTALNIQTLVATKASRICQAARGRPVVDFGTRRAHGPQAGLLAARASYIGGCAGTSNAHAAMTLGIRAVGTQAHSWIMSFDDEKASFEAYAEVFPESAVCLIDTYDTIEGAKRAAKLGKVLKGVRLDSGDLVKLSWQVREILDDAGLADVKIVASSDLNEFIIAEMMARGAKIDSFGVGTDMVTSRDAPALSIVYKLVEVAGRPVKKLSEAKTTLAGAKQIYRYADRDVLARADEVLDGVPLMEKTMTAGELTAEMPDIHSIRSRAAEQLRSLPAHLRDLRGQGHHPLIVSDALRELQKPVCK